MTGHHALISGVDFGEFGRDVKLAAVWHDLGAAADRVDGHLVAAADCEHRFELRFKKAPVAGFGAGMQVMMHHEGFWFRRGSRMTL